MLMSVILIKSCPFFEFFSKFGLYTNVDKKLLLRIRYFREIMFLMLYVTRIFKSNFECLRLVTINWEIFCASATKYAARNQNWLWNEKTFVSWPRNEPFATVARNSLPYIFDMVLTWPDLTKLMAIVTNIPKS
jgi:hypothetical protein